MIIALCVLGSLVVFLSIAFIAVYVQIIRPMREQLAQVRKKQVVHEDTIERNAKSTIGLYMVACKEIAAMETKVAFVEAYSVPVLPAAEDAPPTIRSKC